MQKGEIIEGTRTLAVGENPLKGAEELKVRRRRMVPRRGAVNTQRNNTAGRSKRSVAQSRKTTARK